MTRTIQAMQITFALIVLAILFYAYHKAWSVDRSESVAQAKYAASQPTEYYPPDYQP